MGDDILTIEEVAKYLRVSERTVYDWAQKGEIPAGKIGTVWRFKKSEIENWVNEKLSSSQTVYMVSSFALTCRTTSTQNGSSYRTYYRKQRRHTR